MNTQPSILIFGATGKVGAETARINAEKANFPIALMCQVEMSRSGYYAWSKRPTCSRTQENQQLKEQIQQIHKQSRSSVPRIHAALHQQNFGCTPPKAQSKL